MKTEDMRGLSDGQLLEDLERTRKKLFEIRFQVQARKTKNHQGIAAAKKDIARLLTMLRERELMRVYGGMDIEPVPEQAPVAQAPRRRRRLIGGNS